MSFFRAFTSLMHHFSKIVLLLSMPVVASAQTGGLSKAQGALETLRDNLYIILPIAAVIVGIIIAVLYAAEIMRKDDAVRWGIGVVLAGSIAEIVTLLWR